MEDLEDPAGGLGVAGVDREREARVEMAQRGGLDELAIDLRERARVDAALHERRADAAALDAVAGLGGPAIGELASVSAYAWAGIAMSFAAP